MLQTTWKGDCLTEFSAKYWLSSLQNSETMALGHQPQPVTNHDLFVIMVYLKHRAERTLAGLTASQQPLTNPNRFIISTQNLEVMLVTNLNTCLWKLLQLKNDLKKFILNHDVGFATAII